MPREYKGRPRNIPSQNPERKVPYFPGRQADEEQFAKLRGQIPHGYAPGGAFTVATYDSRLINTIEFGKGFALQEGVGINSARSVATADYIVPAGRTCVLREWGADIYWQVVNATANTGIINVEGVPMVNIQIDFLINDAAVPEFSGLQTGQFCFGPVSGETFIVVPQDQKLTMKLSRIPHPSGAGNFDYTRMQWVDINLRGQLILSTGQTPDFEIGNEEPIPVNIEAKGVAL